jgi:hypothetical protein
MQRRFFFSPLPIRFLRAFSQAVGSKRINDLLDRLGTSAALFLLHCQRSPSLYRYCNNTIRF